MPQAVRIKQADLGKFEKVKQLIQEDITVHYTIQQLAVVAELNEFKLKMGFKKLYKTSIYVFLQDERMKRALRLLSNSEETVETIAKNCGYGYSTNFIAVFRRKFQITPTDYRKSQAIGRSLVGISNQPCFNELPTNPTVFKRY